MADLNANQVRALDAILSTPSIAAASRLCGLSQRTIWRYLADDTFKAALTERQDRVIDATTAALVGLSSKSVEALRDLLQCANTPPGVKARVAIEWLKHARESVELRDLVGRVEQLEKQFGGNSK